MKAILIFNTVNELIYWDWDESFLQQFNVLKDNVDDEIDEHVVAQLLSPVVTSQSIMASQFGNTYSAISCWNNQKIVFTEWLEQLLMNIGKEEEIDLQRELIDCRMYSQYLCLNDASLIRKKEYRKWLSALLKARREDWGATGATAACSGDVGGRALLALREAANMFKLNSKYYHLALFKKANLIALYSTRGSADLTPQDIAMLSLQCKAALNTHKNFVEAETVNLFEASASESDVGEQIAEVMEDGTETPVQIKTEAEEISDTDQPNTFSSQLKLPWLDESGSCVINMCMQDNIDPDVIPCAPHRLRLLPLANEIILVVLKDLGRRESGLKVWKAAVATTVAINESANYIGGGQEMLRITVNKAVEALRRAKLLDSATTLSNVVGSGFAQQPPTQYFKQLAALKTAFGKAAKQLMQLPPSSFSEVKPLKEHLAENTDLANIMQSDGTWQARELVEEFPGLIHFVFFNRKTGRVTAPEPPPPLTQDTVWDILRRGWRCARNATSTTGTFNKGDWAAAAWRQGGLHASWIRWGAPKKAELVVIHLGLVPADIALGAARRLAHALDDLAHPAHHPAHLL